MEFFDKEFLDTGTLNLKDTKRYLLDSIELTEGLFKLKFPHLNKFPEKPEKQTGHTAKEPSVYQDIENLSKADLESQQRAREVLDFLHSIKDAALSGELDIAFPLKPQKAYFYFLLSNVFARGLFAGWLAPLGSSEDKAFKKLVLKFLEGAKKPKKDSLRRVLEEIYSEYQNEHSRFPKWSVVVQKLQRHSKTESSPIKRVTIQDMSNAKGNIEVQGLAKPVTFKALKDRLTKLRKDFTEE